MKLHAGPASASIYRANINWSYKLIGFIESDVYANDRAQQRLTLSSSDNTLAF